MRKSNKNNNIKTYIFRTSLFYNPKIIREIEIPENVNLYKLAGAIVSSYNFDFDHCFGFFNKIAEYGHLDSERKYELFTDLEDEGIKPTGAGSVKKTKIKEVWQSIGDKMLFLFDYGDNWQFIVELIKFGEKMAKYEYPRVLKKVGKAPKQY